MTTRCFICNRLTTVEDASECTDAGHHVCKNHRLIVRYADKNDREVSFLQQICCPDCYKRPAARHDGTEFFVYSGDEELNIVRETRKCSRCQHWSEFETLSGQPHCPRCNQHMTGALETQVFM